MDERFWCLKNVLSPNLWIWFSELHLPRQLLGVAMDIARDLQMTCYLGTQLLL